LNKAIIAGFLGHRGGADPSRLNPVRLKKRNAAIGSRSGWVFDEDTFPEALITVMSAIKAPSAIQTSR